jgi:hypothetical protein
MGLQKMARFCFFFCFQQGLPQKRGMGVIMAFTCTVSLSLVGIVVISSPSVSEKKQAPIRFRSFYVTIFFLFFFFTMYFPFVLFHINTFLSLFFPFSLVSIEGWAGGFL